MNLQRSICARFVIVGMLLPVSDCCAQCELAGLKWQDIDFQDIQTDVQRSVIGQVISDNQNSRP